MVDEKVSESATSNAGQGEVRILLVEDNEINRRVAVMMLSGLGFHADVATSGFEALERVGAQRYDLVFMDIHMPKMDGIETLRRMRELQKDGQRGPVVVAMTADALKGHREKFLESGMDDYLSKPVKTKHLARVLAKHLPQSTEWLERHLNGDGESGDPQGVIDMEAIRLLRSMVGDDARGVVEGILQEFLETTPEELDALKSAVQQADVETVHRISHTLKSSSSVVGATRLAGIFQKIEQVAEQGRLEGVSQDVGHAVSEFRLVEVALAPYC